MEAENDACQWHAARQTPRIGRSESAAYAYYPGCSLHASAQEYDASWRAVCEHLGIELAEMEDWSCCGTVHATTVNRTMSVALAARNLAIAEAMELDVIAPCSGCYKNLRTADEALRQDKGLLQEVNASLPQPIRESEAADGGFKTSVLHPLYVIAGSDAALKEMGLGDPEKLPRPLRGLKAAPYYGCVLTRPAATVPLDDPEDPQSLDRLLTALGADVVPFDAKTKCCGGAVLVSHNDVALDLSGRVLKAGQRGRRRVPGRGVPDVPDGPGRVSEQDRTTDGRTGQSARSLFHAIDGIGSGTGREAPGTGAAFCLSEPSVVSGVGQRAWSDVRCRRCASTAAGREWCAIGMAHHSRGKRISQHGVCTMALTLPYDRSEFMEEVQRELGTIRKEVFRRH